MRLTPRQKEVLENLASVMTDGARVQAQFRLGEKNVTVQVQSLIRHGIIELRGGRLLEKKEAAEPQQPVLDTEAAVSAMRSFLLDNQSILLSTASSAPKDGTRPTTHVPIACEPVLRR